MIRYEFTLTNEHGLHARPASLFISEASSFNSEVSLIKDGKSYNSKSMIGLMKMGASKGDQLVLEVTGDDEDLAFDKLKALIDAGFHDNG